MTLVESMVRDQIAKVYNVEPNFNLMLCSGSIGFSEFELRNVMEAIKLFSHEHITIIVNHVGTDIIFTGNSKKLCHIKRPV